MLQRLRYRKSDISVIKNEADEKYRNHFSSVLLTYATFWIKKSNICEEFFDTYGMFPSLVFFCLKNLHTVQLSYPFDNKLALSSEFNVEVHGSLSFQIHNTIFNVRVEFIMLINLRISD